VLNPKAIEQRLKLRFRSHGSRNQNHREDFYIADIRLADFDRKEIELGEYYIATVDECLTF